MEKTTFIYGLVDPRDNKTKYVGKSNNPKQRLLNHYHDKNPNAKLNWLLYLKNTLGLKPKVIILENDVPMNIWRQRESFWYNFFISIGYELKNEHDPILGGGSTYLTKEQREKTSHKFKGKTLEERLGEEKAKEARRKSSETKRNKTKEEKLEIARKCYETIAKNPKNKLAGNKKISEKWKGKSLEQILKNITPEERNKKIGYGVKNSKKWKEGMKNRNLSGEKNPKFRGIVYQYSKDKNILIKKWKGLYEIPVYQQGNISSVLSGKLKSAYGYFWSRKII